MNQNEIINKILELKANNGSKTEIQKLQQKLDKAANKANNKNNNLSE
jgi:hypothetical protein